MQAKLALLNPFAKFLIWAQPRMIKFSKQENVMRNETTNTWEEGSGLECKVEIDISPKQCSLLQFASLHVGSIASSPRWLYQSVYFTICVFFLSWNAVDLPFPKNSSSPLLKTGSNAIALYVGNSSSFALGQAVSTSNLLDALVYTNNERVDPELLEILTPGKFAYENKWWEGRPTGRWEGVKFYLMDSLLLCFFSFLNQEIWHLTLKRSWLLLRST